MLRNIRTLNILMEHVRSKCDVLPCATQNELNDDEANALVSNGCICVAEEPCLQLQKLF
jgi:glutamate dehydrogenase/leucine dehydrogenase